MALTYDPNFPPSGPAPYAIDRTWCLGDSLPYLNANFRNFDNRIIDTNTTLATVSSNLNTTINSTSGTIITTLSTVPIARLNDGNQSGAAPIFGCRAWVNFDASRNQAGVVEASNTNRFIRASGNVSSVLRNGQGDFTITFTIPMPDANYTLIGQSRPKNATNNPSIFGLFVSSNGSNFTHVNPTPSTARIVTGDSAAAGTWDSDYVMVTVFR